MSIAALLAVFSGLTRNKSDANNTTARLCGIIAVVLLYSSGILIAASLFTYVGEKHPTGYSFALMAIAQFLSFLAAMLVAHWMVKKIFRFEIDSSLYFFLGKFIHGY